MAKKDKREPIIGYKVFNSDLTCRGFQFEIGKSYKHTGELKICNSGFHFCLNASHCFSYYSFDLKNAVCEVEALGDIQTHSEDSKVVTNHIKIIRQLTWDEVLKVSNEGTGNTGHGNAGNDNAGNRNAGNRNAGNRNAGNYNAGNRNAGYGNAGNDNAGAFNTTESFRMFNKQSKWTFEDFRKSKAFELLHTIDTTMWIASYQMSEQEKKDHPHHVTTGGYIKNIPFKEAFVNKWNNWSESSQEAFKNLPGFDSKVFEEATGVKVKK